jgi:hypothetical protein
MDNLLKFITCGSVDDGKSTLIGHMLYDAKLIFADQERALELESKVGSRGGEIDYSLLLDGLMAEREQGITIDVAYRYFTTEKRSFIVADTPGHEEYTRNMAVGASFAKPLSEKFGISPYRAANLLDAQSNTLCYALPWSPAVIYTIGFAAGTSAPLPAISVTPFVIYGFVLMVVMTGSIFLGIGRNDGLEKK